MPNDDIGQTIDIPDYDPNEPANSGSTGAASGTTSNIAGYDVTNEPLAPNLILNRNQTSVGIYTPILTPVSNGYQLSWTNNAGLPNPNAVIISNGTNGTNGTDGTNGADGVTYTPHVAEIADGFQITFTNNGNRPNPSPVEIHNGAEGPQGPQGIQGEPGPAGADGSDGKDGFSPVATVTKSGTIITITITDANGTTTQSFDTATGGGVPINYMEFDSEQEKYTASPATGIELYDEGEEVGYSSYAKMKVSHGSESEKNILIGKPILFTRDDTSGAITSIDVTGERMTITVDDGGDSATLGLVPVYSGAAGYVLTKTESGYGWQAPQGGGGFTPQVILGNQSYPATALQFDPSVNTFSVQAQGSWFGYVVPNTSLYEAAEQGSIQLKNIAINLDTAEAILTDVKGNSFTQHLVPLTGSTGQVLTKSLNGKPTWADVLQLPSGGKTGQMLAKYSAADGAASWVDVAQVPSGGDVGEVLKKYGSADGAYSWGSISEVPSGGSTGDALKKTASGYEWGSISEVPTGGSTGDVLTKTANGYGWATPQSGGGGIDFSSVVNLNAEHNTVGYKNLNLDATKNYQIHLEVKYPSTTTSNTQDRYCTMDFYIVRESGTTKFYPIGEWYSESSTQWHKKVALSQYGDFPYVNGEGVIKISGSTVQANAPRVATYTDEYDTYTIPTYFTGYAVPI